MVSLNTVMDLKFLRIILFGTVMGLITCQRMGPFKVVIGNMVNCGPTSGRGFLYQPHIRRFNRSVFAVETNVTLTMDLDDALDLAVDMSLFTSNGWKANYFKQTFHKACSTVKFYGNDLMANILSKAGLKAQCPIPKGNYIVKDLPLTMEVPGVPAFFYNKYKWRGKIVDGGDVVGCIETIVDIVPKKKH